ncbi:MAG: hypothetical protein AMXMBFR75_22490 [Candidatus Hinthialibacteria bacterium]
MLCECGVAKPHFQFIYNSTVMLMCLYCRHGEIGRVCGKVRLGHYVKQKDSSLTGIGTMSHMIHCGKISCLGALITFEVSQ